MNIPIEEFFKDFQNEIATSARNNENFLHYEFTQKVTQELIESGHITNFEESYYDFDKMRIDGYNYDDDILDLFITDYDNNNDMGKLSQKDVSKLFQQIKYFFIKNKKEQFYKDLEETHPIYILSRKIYEAWQGFRKINLYILSNRALSDKIKLDDYNADTEESFIYHIWDMSRLYRALQSRGMREAIEIDFMTLTGNKGIGCLPAYGISSSYQSYLLVMPANILSHLYKQYGQRLLEQNVRSFLQARGKVNKGIRTTILKNPEMFFAYNNGITATATKIDVFQNHNATSILKITDLQVVNGGQTMASLFHTAYKDKASLDNIFVQVKLSVINSSNTEEIVSNISEYANTQNKVNAADFFSNHPFHIKLEEFSRRIWVQTGLQKDSKWFYERARGQYLDAQSKLTVVAKKNFQNEYPKRQMFTKTDLAKFENVWDDNPANVCLGGQKNFIHFAKRISKSYKDNPEHINEFYFKRLIARAIIFRHLENIIPHQEWYQGGYRAYIVAYTIGMLAHICRIKQQEVDFMKIWQHQTVSDDLSNCLKIISHFVYHNIANSQGTMPNLIEWCRSKSCWDYLQKKSNEMIILLPDAFDDALIDTDMIKQEKKDAYKLQKQDNGINNQSAVIKISSQEWIKILTEGKKKRLFSESQINILELATKIPSKIPNEKQSEILMQILRTAQDEAII